jgi:hypothetical protein
MKSKEPQLIQAYIEHNGDIIKAYRSAVPMSKNWKDETVEKKAQKFFDQPGIRQQIADLQGQQALKDLIENTSDSDTSTEGEKTEVETITSTDGYSVKELPSQESDDTQPEPVTSNSTESQSQQQESKETHESTEENQESNMGRPTKWKGQETIDKTLEYITEGYKALDEKFPTRAGLAVTLEIHRETINEWAKIYHDFSDALAKLMAIQELNLVSKGVGGEYNPTITKLLLQSNHKHVERSQAGIAGIDGAPPIQTENTTDARVITAEMSDEEATRAYKDMMRGK